MKHLVLFVICITVIGCGKSRSQQESEARYAASVEKLQQADRDWEAGRKAEAAEAYATLLGSRGGFEFAVEYHGEFPRLYSRIIDFQVERAGPEAGREYIRKALRDRVTLMLSTPEANAVLAEERAKYKDKDQIAWENRSRSSTGSSSRRGTSKEEMNRLFEILVNQVRAGMSSQEVRSLMGSPHDTNYSNVAGENLETWTYRSSSDKNDFIILGFQDGKLVDGDTGGYDIHKGFKMKLPR